MHAHKISIQKKRIATESYFKHHNATMYKKDMMTHMQGCPDHIIAFVLDIFYGVQHLSLNIRGEHVELQPRSHILTKSQFREGKAADGFKQVYLTQEGTVVGLCPKFQNRSCMGEHITKSMRRSTNVCSTCCQHVDECTAMEHRESNNRR